MIGLLLTSGLSPLPARSPPMSQSLEQAKREGADRSSAEGIRVPRY